MSRAVSRNAMGLIAVLVLSLGQLLPAQTQHPVSGRRIAPGLGVGGADWMERNERELEEMPEAALDAIGIQPGMKIADVGAGVGYFTLRLARRAGPTGLVYANDVQPELLSILRERAAKEKLTNVRTVLGSEANPRLPKGMFDLVLMIDVYHELSQPQRMLEHVREALKPGGTLVMLEYRKEDPHIPVRIEHRMSVAEAKMEVEAEGFNLEKALETLPRQHILIFSKKAQ